MGVLSTENRHLNHHKNILILVKVKEKIKYDEMFSSQKRNLRLLINQRKLDDDLQSAFRMDSGSKLVYLNILDS